LSCRSTCSWHGHLARAYPHGRDARATKQDAESSYISLGVRGGIRVAPIRVLLAAAEVVGFAKTGGLADVAGSLPRALARLGHQVAVVMPLYRGVRHGKVPLDRTEAVLSVPIGTQTLACRLYRATLPGSDVPLFFPE